MWCGDCGYLGVRPSLTGLKLDGECPPALEGAHPTFCHLGRDVTITVRNGKHVAQLKQSGIQIPRDNLPYLWGAAAAVRLLLRAGIGAEEIGGLGLISGAAVARDLRIRTHATLQLDAVRFTPTSGWKRNGAPSTRLPPASARPTKSVSRKSPGGSRLRSSLNRWLFSNSRR